MMRMVPRSLMGVPPPLGFGFDVMRSALSNNSAALFCTDLVRGFGGLAIAFSLLREGELHGLAVASSSPLLSAASGTKSRGSTCSRSKMAL